jgi:Zn-dependent protease with chaperone function
MSPNAPAPSPVAARVMRAERSQRRVTLLGVVTLLVMAVLPLAVDHLPIGLELALAGFDHLGALCIAALHLLLAPVHGGFHVVLGAGVLYAAYDRVRAWRHLEHVLAPLDAEIPSAASVIGRAARIAGVSLERVRVVSGLPNPAFTVGLLAPRIYVAAELPYRLDRDELICVMRHEAAHLARRDPLRLSLLRGLACTLFWMPALARLAEDLRDDSEIIADDVATERGSAVVLASAILTLASWSAVIPPQGAVGLCHPSLLERRVRRLLGEEVRVGTHLTRRALGLAALALGMAWVTGLLMVHPLPDGATAARADTHCEHQTESPLAHLFCRGTHSGACPHATLRPPAHTHTG